MIVHSLGFGEVAFAIRRFLSLDAVTHKEVASDHMDHIWGLRGQHVAVS